MIDDGNTSYNSLNCTVLHIYLLHSLRGLMVEPDSLISTRGSFRVPIRNSKIVIIFLLGCIETWLTLLLHYVSYVAFPCYWLLPNLLARKYFLVVFRGDDISSANHQNGAAEVFIKINKLKS